MQTHWNSKGNWLEVIHRFTYRHLVKDKCAGCGNRIVEDIERYEHRGNFCVECDVKATKNVKKRVMSEKELDAAFRQGQNVL